MEPRSMRRPPESDRHSLPSYVHSLSTSQTPNVLYLSRCIICDLRSERDDGDRGHEISPRQFALNFPPCSWAISESKTTCSSSANHEWFLLVAAGRGPLYSSSPYIPLRWYWYQSYWSMHHMRHSVHDKCLVSVWVPSFTLSLSTYQQNQCIHANYM